MALRLPNPPIDYDIRWANQYTRAIEEAISLNQQNIQLLLNSTSGTPVAVALLPAPTAGKRAFVTDATLTVTLGIGTIVAGTGGNVVPVYADGINWRIG